MTSTLPRTARDYAARRDPPGRRRPRLGTRTAHTPAYALTEAGRELGPAVLVQLAEGRTTFAEAIRNKRIAGSGDKDALRRVRTVFRWPSAARRAARGVTDE
ncbi:MAG: hypothetical protein ACJ73U_40895 [Actinophytocola sp.]